ncbi:MFS transporter [Sporolactobacillus pectinivorans]|uniref:MFS transporter n=1 Tax=Sporolactobacillus pectinivorans TaxID=1591408 RepID=UPI000C2697ED|nr:MFS transporter [Sporolactobacillus pectinivorans]
MNTLKKMTPKLMLILFGLLLTNTGSFMILPFLSLYLSNLNLSTAMIGFVLMVNVICQRGLTFFGGMLNDQFGERKLLIIGLSVRLTGYILYSFAGHLSLIFVASAFVGLGGALFAPGLMATIAKLAGDLKPEVFALRNAVINVGSSLGPILGGVLYQYSVFWVFMLTSMAHFIFLLFIIFSGPRDINAKRRVPVIGLFRSVIQNRAILILTLMNTIFWFVYSQFNLAIPLYMKDVFREPSLIGLLFTINGLFVILLQFAIAQMIFRRSASRTALLYGFFFMSSAYFVLGLFPYLPFIFLFVLLCSTSEVLVFPTIDNLVSELANADFLSTYYGFVDMGWAVGATLGNLLGGIFFGFAQANHLLPLAWFSYGALALIAVFFVFLLGYIGQPALKTHR